MQYDSDCFAYFFNFDNYICLKMTGNSETYRKL